MKFTAKFLQPKTAKKGSDEATWHGRPFYAGIADVLDGQIEAVCPYEKAALGSFHHANMFSDYGVGAVNDGRCILFFVEGGQVKLVERRSWSREAREVQWDELDDGKKYRDGDYNSRTEGLPTAALREIIRKQIVFRGQKTAGAYLYHGTSSTALQAILANGGIMKAPSYWGSERIAQYYAEVAVEEEEENGNDEASEVILRVPLQRFNSKHFIPDQNSIAEPIAYTLGTTEDKLWAQWKKCKDTWQDCLRIYESVVYKSPVKITQADVLNP